MLRRIFIAGALGWVLLLPAAAFAASRPGEPALAYSAALVYMLGSVICHQIPTRSFELWSQPLAVCARCCGVYTGAALIAIYAAAAGTARLRAAGGGAATRVFMAIAALPTLATLTYEWTIGTAPSNIVRAVAGLSLGAAASAIVLAATDDRVN